MREEFETTTLTSKGQMVIPQNIRERMHLHKGMKFLVMGRKDTLVLKKMDTSRMAFEGLLKKTRQESRKSPIVRRLSKMSEKQRMEQIQKIIHQDRGVKA